MAIKLVSLKGDQPWILTGRTDAEVDILVIWCKQMTHWKRPWCWERSKAEGEKGIRGWEGWMTSLRQLDITHELGQSPGDGGGQGGLVCCSPWGCKEVNMTGRLSNKSKAKYKTTNCEKWNWRNCGGKEYLVGSCYSEMNWKDLFREMKVKMRLYKQKDEPEQMWVLLYEISYILRCTISKLKE